MSADKIDLILDSIKKIEGHLEKINNRCEDHGERLVTLEVRQGTLWDCKRDTRALAYRIIGMVVGALILAVIAYSVGKGT